MPKKRPRFVQQPLIFRPTRRGGARKGAGRKPKGAEAGVSHAPRERLTGKHPVHVTLKVVRGVRSVRSRLCFPIVELALTLLSASAGLRLTQYSVQDDHLHLILEAASARALSRGIQGLSVRLARRLNRVLGRKGRLLSDRYHVHVLRTPTEVRRALAYVLGNGLVHAARAGFRVDGPSNDPFAHGGDVDSRVLGVPLPCGPPLTAPAQTWLLRVGWMRGR